MSASGARVMRKIYEILPLIFEIELIGKTIVALLQDAANATLRSGTLRKTVCDAIIANGAVWKPSEMCKVFAMIDASNTVQVLVTCAMKGIQFSSMDYLQWGGTKETGSHMEACAIHSIQFTRMNCLWLDNTKEIDSQIKGVCEIWHAEHSHELFALRHENRNDSNEQDVCDMRQTGL